MGRTEKRKSSWGGVTEAASWGLQPAWGRRALTRGALHPLGMSARKPKSALDQHHSLSHASSLPPL